MEIAAIIRKAIPVNSLSPSVMNHTTMATIAAGRKKNRTLAMNTIIKIPTIKRISKMANSKSPGMGSKGKTTPSVSPLV